MAVHHVVLPCAGVGGHALPLESALPALLTVEETAYILVAIGKTEGAFARAFAILILAFVDVAVAELIDAPAVLHIVFPFSIVIIAVGIEVGAAAIALVVEPRAFVF